MTLKDIHSLYKILRLMDIIFSRLYQILWCDNYYGIDL